MPYSTVWPNRIIQRTKFGRLSICRVDVRRVMAAREQNRRNKLAVERMFEEARQPGSIWQVVEYKTPIFDAMRERGLL